MLLRLRLNQVKKCTAHVACALFYLTLHSAAQPPQLINYQGRIAVSGTNFTGTGLFQFALVNNGASQTYWSNGVDSVSVAVNKGLYAVMLGDTNLGGMAAFPSAIFTNNDVRLRVWFNDGFHGAQLLVPDQRIATAGLAAWGNADSLGNSLTNYTDALRASITNGTISVNGTPLLNFGLTSNTVLAAYNAANYASMTLGAWSNITAAAGISGGAAGIPAIFIAGGMTNAFGSAAASEAGDFLSSSSNGLSSITISEAPVGTYINRVELAGTPSGSHLGIYQHVPYAWPPAINGWISEALLYTVYSNGNTQRVGGIGVRNGYGAFMYCSTNEPYFQFFDDNHQLRPIVVSAIRLARSPTNDGPAFAATTGQMWMNTNSMICVLTNPTTQVSLAYVASNTTLEATIAGYIASNAPSAITAATVMVSTSVAIGSPSNYLATIGKDLVWIVSGVSTQKVSLSPYP